MRKGKKINCTKSTLGKVTNLRIRGQDFPTMITVEYMVDGELYSVTESIKLKSEKIKKGIFTIGQRRVATMGETSVGAIASVRYNPANPNEAFLEDNTGKANV